MATVGPAEVRLCVGWGPGGCLHSPNSEMKGVNLNCRIERFADRKAKMTCSVNEPNYLVTVFDTTQPPRAGILGSSCTKIIAPPPPPRRLRLLQT